MMLKLIDFHGTNREDDHSLRWQPTAQGRASIHFIKSETSCEQPFSRVRFTGFDPSGECVFGPLVQMALPAIRLEDVPAHTVRLRVEYLRGREVVCIESVAVSLQANETTVLGGGTSHFEKLLTRAAQAELPARKTRPTFSKVFSLELSPSTAPLPPRVTVTASVENSIVGGQLRLEQHCLVTDYLNSTVSSYRLDRDGLFQQRTELETGAGPSALAVHPNGLSFYVTNSLSDNVSVFSFSAGQGAALKQAIRSGKCPDSITLSPNGRYAYVSNTLDQTVSIYAVQSDSTLKPVCSTDIEGTPTRLVFHPGGCFAYLINQSKGVVHTYRVYSDGRLSLYSEVRTEQRPEALAVSPSGDELFAADAAGSVYSFRVGELGGLRRVDSREIGGHLNAVAIHPRLRTVYFADSRTHRIVWIGFDSQGGFCGEPEETACPGARSLALSGSGGTLFSLNSLGGSLAKYEVKDDGRLVCQQALSLGGTPLNLVLTP